LFGKAYSDTPLGDLNGDGIISGPSNNVIENSFSFPYGTTENFPDFLEDNTAHRYSECSNAVLNTLNIF
jgi:hypothetical protein